MVEREELTMINRRMNLPNHRRTFIFNMFFFFFLSFPLFFLLLLGAPLFAVECILTVFIIGFSFPTIMRINSVTRMSQVLYYYLVQEPIRFGESVLGIPVSEKSHLDLGSYKGVRAQIELADMFFHNYKASKNKESLDFSNFKQIAQKIGSQFLLMKKYPDCYISLVFGVFFVLIAFFDIGLQYFRYGDFFLNGASESQNGFIDLTKNGCTYANLIAFSVMLSSLIMPFFWRRAITSARPTFIFKSNTATRNRALNTLGFVWIVFLSLVWIDFPYKFAMNVLNPSFEKVVEWSFLNEFCNYQKGVMDHDIMVCPFYYFTHDLKSALDNEYNIKQYNEAISKVPFFYNSSFDKKSQIQYLFNSNEKYVDAVRYAGSLYLGFLSSLILIIRGGYLLFVRFFMNHLKVRALAYKAGLDIIKNHPVYSQFALPENPPSAGMGLIAKLPFYTLLCSLGYAAWILLFVLFPYLFNGSHHTGSLFATWAFGLVQWHALSLYLFGYLLFRLIFYKNLIYFIYLSYYK